VSLADGKIVARFDDTPKPWSPRSPAALIHDAFHNLNPGK